MDCEILGLFSEEILDERDLQKMSFALNLILLSKRNN